MRTRRDREFDRQERNRTGCTSAFFIAFKTVVCLAGGLRNEVNRLGCERTPRAVRRCMDHDNEDDDDVKTEQVVRCLSVASVFVAPPCIFKPSDQNSAKMRKCSA